MRPRRRSELFWWRAVVTSIWGLALTSYSLLAPTFEAPDEHAHVDMVLFHEESGLGVINNRGRFVSVAVEEALKLSGQHEDPRPVGMNLPYAERPQFADLPLGRPGPNVNYTQQTPSFYYYVLAAEGRLTQWLLPGAPLAYDEHTWMYRLLSALFLLPLPVIVGRVARVLSDSRRAEQAAMLVPFMFPQLLHMGGAVTNDDLLITTAALTILGIVRIAAKDLSLSVALGTGVSLGLCALVKSSALTLIPAVVLALLIGGHFTIRRVPWNAVIMGAAAMAVGGWFYVRNIFEYGSVLTPVEPPLHAPAPPWFVPDTIWWFKKWFPNMAERFVGWFGYFEVRMPLQVSWLVVIAVLVLLRFAGRELGWRKLMVALAPLVFAAAAVMQLTYGAYVEVGMPIAVQGRYLFPGAVGLWALVGVGEDSLVRRANLSLWPARSPIVAVAVIANVFAFDSISEFYWGEGYWARLDNWAQYTPIPGSVSLAIVIFTFAAAASALAISSWPRSEVALVEDGAPEPAPLPAPN